MGYYEDDVLPLLLEGISVPPRDPIMLRGYYIRSHIMRDMVRKFLQHQESDQPAARQIVNLGAGFDTLYFYLQKHSLANDNLQYYEMDFVSNFQNKVRAMSKHGELLQRLDNPTLDAQNGTLHSSHYHILPCDLRDLDSFTKLLYDNGFDARVPTLFLSECVMIYMQPEYSQAIVNWIKNTLSTAFFCLYEQIRPNDPFGKEMIFNLQRRGCALLGLHAFPDEEAQRRRFLDAGWDHAESYDLNIMYQRYVTPDERRRIERIQMLDELEEWILINQHYCISWASCNSNPDTHWDLRMLTESSKP